MKLWGKDSFVSEVRSFITEFYMVLEMTKYYIKVNHLDMMVHYLNISIQQAKAE